jgi:hypothetical protein
MSLEALIQFFSPFVNNHKKRRTWSPNELEALSSTDYPVGSSHEVQSNALLAWCRVVSQRNEA